MKCASCAGHGTILGIRPYGECVTVSGQRRTPCPACQPSQLAATVDEHGTTVLKPATPAPERPRHAQDRLFSAERTIPGQISLGTDDV